MTNFTVGARVQLHPATDLWMRGARFGEIVKVGRKWLHVKVDRTGKVAKLSRTNVISA